jgi:ABC-type antimicrobial peptide transport system permease subunit
MIVRQGLALGMAGTAIGVMLSVGLAGLLDFLVYGIPARDPVTFMLVPALVMFVTLLASWGPAQVATRIDPRALLNGD